MTAASRSPLRLLCLLGLLAAGCPESPTVIVVEVQARPTLQGVDTLEVTVANAGGSASQAFALGPGQTLPLSFTVTPEGRTGALDITVVARGNGLARGRGAASVEIRTDARTDVTLMLEPDDFLINEQTVRTQWLSFDEDMAGRQLAVAPDGSFVVTFENDCPLSRCDILGRRFDATTAPAQNATTATAGDFIVNQSSDSTVSPSIATGTQGYLVAWLFTIDSLQLPADVKATLLGFDGGHPEPFEITISTAAEIEREPTAIARSDGSFVVVWSKERPAPGVGSEVRARIVAADGTLVGNEIAVSAAPAGDQRLPHAVGLPGGAFVVVWTHSEAGVTNVRARVFTQNGNPATGNDVAVTNAATGIAYGARVAATPEGGFVVGWQFFSSSTPELTKQPLLLRRFVGNGNPVSTEIPVAPESERINATPTLAVRADGAIGVVWHDCGDHGDAPASCGIRFRLLHPTGMPVGDSVVVNTTTARDQLSPSIVVLGGDAFLVAWTDNSNQPPDTDGSGVRGRVIYPTLARHDGVLGARCGGAGDAECGQGLTCQPAADGTALCHEACTVTCVNGGVCLNGSHCAFQ